MSDGVIVSARRTASAVAPVIDRLRLAVVRGVLVKGLPESVRRSGIDEASGSLLAYLRNTYPDRVVSRSALAAVFTYQGADVDGGVDRLLAHDLVAEPVEGMIALTEQGRACVADLLTGSSQVVDELWAAGPVDTVGPLVERALSAARATGGETFALMAPQETPDGMSAAGMLAERLTGLRFHRFDAHIAAWRSAGLTAEEVVRLPAGEQRRTIEDDTNLRAAAPYLVLDDDERLALVAGLGALGG